METLLKLWDEAISSIIGKGIALHTFVRGQERVQMDDLNIFNSRSLEKEN